jgi:hypothetical protein
MRWVLHPLIHGKGSDLTLHPDVSRQENIMDFFTQLGNSGQSFPYSIVTAERAGVHVSTRAKTSAAINCFAKKSQDVT